MDAHLLTRMPNDESLWLRFLEDKLFIHVTTDKWYMT